MTSNKKITLKSLSDEVKVLREQVKEVESLKQKVIHLESKLKGIEVNKKEAKNYKETFDVESAKMSSNPRRALENMFLSYIQ